MAIRIEATRYSWNFTSFLTLFPLVVSGNTLAGEPVSTPVTETFDCEGGKSVTWTVPSGVSEITIDMAGGRGGDAPGRIGGEGGTLDPNDLPVIEVTDGQEFQLIVGCHGQNGGSNPAGGGAGYGRGGDGGQGAGESNRGAGGGGSTAFLTDDGDPLIVTGGGGGATDHNSGANTTGRRGGHGGGLEGNDGAPDGENFRGRGGTQSGPGVGGGDPGSGPNGGDGSTVGGGGGGGYFGASGGETFVENNEFDSGGGGGGSGHLADGISGTLVTGGNTGHGFIEISYVLVQNPAVSLTKTLESGSPYSAPGDTLNYTLTVENTGNVDLTDVDITDPDAVIDNCSPASGSMLVPTDTMTCEATYTVTQADIDAGSFVNTATVEASAPDSSSVEASDSATAFTDYLFGDRFEAEN